VTVADSANGGLDQPVKPPPLAINPAIAATQNSLGSRTPGFREKKI
jgi:hypothetical protein